MAQSFLQTPRRVNENDSNAAFLNGKSVQRNDISKRKTALGDIKNYAPMTPGIGCDKKSSNHLNENQMNLFGDVGIMKNSWEIPSDICSSEPVDYERMWAERLQLSDEEVNCILSKGFYEDDERDLLPPPPSPHDMEIVVPPAFFPDMLDLLPPPLDFDDHFDDEPPSVEPHNRSDDESSLNRSIFEFSDTDDFSFDDLATNFAGRMHF